jgi:aryl-alcohol dehydrogenase-like predicted oxidoreductase
VMPVYNPVDRRSATVIDQAAAAGLGVMAAAPLARMAFAPRDGDWTTPAGWWTAARRFRDRWLSNRTAAGAHELHFLSEIEQWTAAQASLGVVLSNSNVHCAVFATTNPVHLKSNVAASGRPLPSAIQTRLDAL